MRTDWKENIYRTLKYPQGFPNKSSVSDDQKKVIASDVLNKWRDKFDQNIHDLDKAWHVLAQISEDYLRTIHAESKHIGEGGRHSSVKFQQMNATQSAASKKHPVDSGTFALTKAYKVQRQSYELRVKLQKSSQNERGLHDTEVLEKSITKYSPTWDWFSLRIST